MGSSVEKYSFNSGTGHFTQIAWATTKTIGCGMVVYKANGWNNQFTVNK
jgi:hypothetical protein